MINYHHSTANNQSLIIFICSSQPSGTGTQERLGRRQVARPAFRFRPPVIQGIDDCSCCCFLVLLSLISHFILLLFLAYVSWILRDIYFRNLHRELNTAQEDLQYTKVSTHFLFQQLTEYHSLIK